MVVLGILTEDFVGELIAFGVALGEEEKTYEALLILLEGVGVLDVISLIFLILILLCSVGELVGVVELFGKFALYQS